MKMKKIAVRLVLALAVCSLLGTTAMAKSRQRSVTFGQDFIVGGTTVAAGTYKLVYDEQAGELTFVDKKKAVVARAQARLEKRDNATFRIAIVWADQGRNKSLVSVGFPRDSHYIVLAAAGGGAAAEAGGSR